jgi:hypothetical protein
MSKAENVHESEPSVAEDRESALEQMLIDQYLAGKGYSLAAWQKLPAEEAKQLMIEACRYAALRLTEIDSSAHLWAELHGRDKSF